MSKVGYLEWDSRIFGEKTGKVDDYAQIPDQLELSTYKYIHVQIPQEEVELIWEYQKIGFRYITLDYSLEKTPALSETVLPEDYRIFFIRKQQPTFRVSGFKLFGSRLVIDPELNQHLSENFWDQVIQGHCSNFADFALCATDQGNQLIGFISCFERPDAIDMFLVLVHPDYRNMGVGRTLISALESRAFSTAKKLTTSVVANNLEAMNFYFRNGFFLKRAHVIMHYSNL